MHIDYRLCSSLVAHMVLCVGAWSKGGGDRTNSTRIQWFHVKDIDALHLPQNLISFKAGRLLEVCWDGAGSGSGREEIFWAFDVCEGRLLAIGDYS